MRKVKVGEILRNGAVERFLDIHPRIIELGTASGGYDERGLLGLAFHPDFYDNGLLFHFFQQKSHFLSM